MKKVAFNLIVLLIFLCSTTFAQLTISVVGSNDVCVGSGVNLIVNNPDPNYNYTWWVDNYTCGVASSAFTYGYGPNILVYGTGTFHCEALASGLPPLFSQNLSVRVLPGSFGSTLLPLPYSSSTVTCTTSVNLCIPNAFYQNFPGTILKWYKNGIEIPGATGSGYTATTDGFYKYSVTSSCITAYSDSVEFISASAIPSFTTTAVSPVCNGNTINFSATNPVAGAVYTWQTSNFPSSGFTASGSGPNFSYIVPSALNLYVRLQRVIPGCSVQITPAVGYTIQNISRQISPFATQNICTGDSVTLTINISGGPATLQWMKNGIPIPGATGTSYKASSSGVYRVDVTSACGVSYSNDVTVVVHSYPTVVINAASATTFCAGGSVNLNANAGPGLTYQWKKYGNPIAGATSPNYTATGAGIYKVTVTNAGGCSANSSSITVTVNALPTAAITSAGPTAICPGSSVTLNANTGAGLTYQWRKYSNDIAGATNSTYAATGAGQYKVRVTNANGCSKNSNTITVTTLTSPAATITANGPTSFCAGDSVKLTANSGSGLSYQWKKGSNNIAGATLLNYTAKNAGNYKVTVTGSNGCSKNSNVIAVSVPCRTGIDVDESNNFNISAIPNPFEDKIRISVNGTITANLRVRIFTMEGKEIHVKPEMLDDTNFILHNLNTGIYLVEVSDDMNSKRIKIICTR